MAPVRPRPCCHAQVAAFRVAPSHLGPIHPPSESPLTRFIAGMIAPSISLSSSALLGFLLAPPPPPPLPPLPWPSLPPCLSTRPRSDPLPARPRLLCRGSRAWRRAAGGGSPASGSASSVRVSPPGLERGAAVEKPMGGRGCGRLVWTARGPGLGRPSRPGSSGGDSCGERLRIEPGHGPWPRSVWGVWQAWSWCRSSWSGLSDRCHGVRDYESVLIMIPHAATPVPPCRGQPGQPRTVTRTGCLQMLPPPRATCPGLEAGGGSSVHPTGSARLGPRPNASHPLHVGL